MRQRKKLIIFILGSYLPLLFWGNVLVCAQTRETKPKESVTDVKPKESINGTKPKESMIELIEKTKSSKDATEKSKIISEISRTTPSSKEEVKGLLNLAEEGKLPDTALQRSLMQIKDPAFGIIFVEAIKTGSFTTKLISIRVLGNLKYKDAVPDLINIVKTKYSDINEEKLGIAAAFALGEIADERALPVLLDKLGKMYAMEGQIIAKFGNKALPPLLEIIVTSKDDDAKREAYNTIGLIRDKHAIPALWRILREEKDGKLVMATLGALLGTTDKTTEPSYDDVVRYVFDHANTDKILRGKALIIAKEQNNIQFLIDILTKDDDHGRRTSAIIYLGELKAQLAVPALLEALNDRDREIRYRASVALKQITGRNYEWKGSREK